MTTSISIIEFNKKKCTYLIWLDYSHVWRWHQVSCTYFVNRNQVIRRDDLAYEVVVNTVTMCGLKTDSAQGITASANANCARYIAPRLGILYHLIFTVALFTHSAENWSSTIFIIIDWSYGHIGPKTVWTRDTSAPVPKYLRTVWYWCRSVRSFRYQDISALRHFRPSVEIVHTIGPDTLVLGPGHFGTSAELSKYDRVVKSCRDRDYWNIVGLRNDTYTGKYFTDRCNTQAKCFFAA